MFPHYAFYPIFPKDLVYKKYSDWRSAVANFELTNAVPDAVKIQHLKEACKGSEGDAIVSLFKIEDGNFASAMRALDERFLVARVIITEYINSVVMITPKHDKRMHAKHLREIIDNFNALTTNIESIARKSLAVQGVDEPTDLILAEAKSNALLLGLILRTLDDYLKTNISSLLNLKSLEIPDAKSVLKALEKRLVATQGNESTKMHSTMAAVASVGFRKQPSKFKKKGENKLQAKKKSTTRKECFLCLNSSHPTSKCWKQSTIIIQNKVVFYSVAFIANPIGW